MTLVEILVFVRQVLVHLHGVDIIEVYGLASDHDIRCALT